jgi:hypothetical protein
MTVTHRAVTVADLNLLLDTGQTFGTIYADPPWRYSRGNA